jgi:hypothetical protein
MTVVELPAVSVLAIQAASQQDAYPRSAGLHLSAVIRHIMQALDPEAYGPQDAIDDTTRNRWALGLLFEEILSAMYASRRRQAFVEGVKPPYEFVGRPGEVMVDGIAMSPDGLVSDTDGPALLESKLTWKSKRGFDLDGKKFVAWKWQAMGYSRALGVTRAYLPVFWINGSYDGYLPELVEYRVDFTPRELEENWTMLLNHAKGLR